MSKKVQLVLVGLVFFLLGCLLAPQLPFARAQGTSKDPVWKHGLSLSCRQSKEADFSKDTKKFGIEVYQDANNGNWIYVSDTGSIAVVPGK